MAALELSYTIQFSKLMLYVKYQELGLCDFLGKCDKNYIVMPDGDNARRRQIRRQTTNSDPNISHLCDEGDTKNKMAVKDTTVCKGDS